MTAHTHIFLDERVRKELERIVKGSKSEQRLVFRARLILALGEGKTNAVAAQENGTHTATVSRWRRRFAL